MNSLIANILFSVQSFPVRIILRARLIFGLVPVLLLFSIQAQAISLAVFPVEDLSKGVNVANLEVTRYLADELAEMDVEVVSETDIMSFMAAERIRWVGYLDLEHILRANKALGADVILLGTICQRQERSSPALSLSLSLIRAQDAKTIWSVTEGLSLFDMQRLLGLNEPASLDDLWQILARNIIAEWPVDLAETLAQPLVFDIENGEFPPYMPIEDIKLAPRFVRPGEQVKCSVRLGPGKEYSEMPQIFIKVGNRVHLAQENREGLFYEASWTGSEIEKGIFREVGHESLFLASTELDAKFFEGFWPSPLNDDIYPVSLILRWPTGEQQVSFVGTYVVDSTPPEIDLVLKGRKNIDDLVAFNDHLAIFPTMIEREPISHWQIQVEDENGIVVIGDEGDGSLPEKLQWKGRKYSGFFADDGIYRLALKAWDRAGNEMKVVKEVAFRPNPPDMILNIEVENEGLLLLKLDMAEVSVPLSFWKLEFWSDNGELLKTANGNEVPATIEFHIPENLEKTKIEGIIAMRNIIGNQTIMNIDDLYLLAMGKEDPAGKESQDTVKDGEKDDSWVWAF